MKPEIPRLLSPWMLLWCLSWPRCSSTWVTTSPRQPTSRWSTSGYCSTSSSHLLTFSCKLTSKLCVQRKRGISTIMAKPSASDHNLLLPSPLEVLMLKCKMMWCINQITKLFSFQLNKWSCPTRSTQAILQWNQWSKQKQQQNRNMQKVFQGVLPILLYLFCYYILDFGTTKLYAGIGGIFSPIR